MILKGTLRDWTPELTKLVKLRHEWLLCHRFHVIGRKSARRLTHSEYDTYRSILQRCNNPKNPAYAYYGGKNIKCLFPSAYAIIKAIGHKPHGSYSIDRIDSSGHYEASNVQWLTRSDNSKKSWKDRRKKI